MYHVTSVANRGSIDQHGLDWRRMGAAPGIAGSTFPGPVDVWAVDGIDEFDLEESPEGFFYFPGVIARKQLRLLRRDVPPAW